MKTVIALLLMTISYFIGNISPATLLARAAGKDIKKEGSGNAGATNVLRVLGAKAAVVTLVIDVAKGFLATALGFFAATRSESFKALRMTLQLRRLGVADVGEARAGHAVAGDLLGPHGQRAHPEAARAVERLIDHQRLKRLRVPRNPDHAVIISLKMAINAGLEFFHKTPGAVDSGKCRDKPCLSGDIAVQCEEGGVGSEEGVDSGQLTVDSGKCRDKPCLSGDIAVQCRE